jgi:hypothetical protein
MTITAAVKNWIRSLLSKRYHCGCSIVTVEQLDGQHPWNCRHHTDPYGLDVAHFRVGNLAPHQVDGVVMPWASINGKDMSSRWCDFSELGDGRHLGRRFDGTHHFAMASRTGTGWHWVIFDVREAGGEPEQLAAGDVDKVTEVMESVCGCEAKLELAA